MAANSSLMITADAIEPLSFASNDSDSGYDEKSLSTASIASSIYDYEQENGRTYHAYNAGKYALPNDEGEQERMDPERNRGTIQGSRQSGEKRLGAFLLKISCRSVRAPELYDGV